MASPVYLWFSKEVFYWRSLAATLWAVICLTLPVCLMSFALNMSLVHPFAWFSGTIDNMLSVGFMFAATVFIIAVVMVTWFSLSYLSVKPDIHNSRLASVVGLLRWSRLPLFVICILNGTLCAWSVAYMSGMQFTDFVSTDAYERLILNEGCLFIVGCGTFAGFCYYCHFFTNQEFYLTFPNIQRQRVFQVRSETKLIANRLAWQSLHVVKYYYILYFLFGSLPRTWICLSFGINEDSASVPMDTIFGLMSLTLFWKTYLTTFIITFALSFAFAACKTFHTQQLIFPVTSVMEESSGNTLPDALTCTYSPLLQHLAFYDLSCLSKFVSDRIQEVLSLSQPGGHPKVWTQVSGSALGILQELTNQIKEENWSIMSKVPSSINYQRNAGTGGVGTSNTTINGQQQQHTFHSSFGSSGDRLDSSIVYRGEISTNGTELPKKDDKADKPGFMLQLTVKLSSMPILSQFLAQSQDTSTRRLFASCQLHIWAVESLSHIASRAYTEDRYGIVQGCLPIIFVSLLELYEAMEKHLKLSPIARRSNGSIQASSVDCLNRYKLQAVVKSSIYRMVDTYRDHLEDIRLRPEEIKKLMPFIQYAL